MEAPTTKLLHAATLLACVLSLILCTGCASVTHAYRSFDKTTSRALSLETGPDGKPVARYTIFAGGAAKSEVGLRNAEVERLVAELLRQIDAKHLPITGGTPRGTERTSNVELPTSNIEVKAITGGTPVPRADFKSTIRNPKSALK